MTEQIVLRKQKNWYEAAVEAGGLAPDVSRAQVNPVLSDPCGI